MILFGILVFKYILSVNVGFIDFIRLFSFLEYFSCLKKKEFSNL